MSLPKPGEGIRQVSPLVSFDWAVSALLHAKPDSQWSKRKSSPEESTDVKAGGSKCRLEHLEQDMAPREVLVIHWSLAVSCCNSSSCHWIKNFPDQESRIAPVHQSSHDKTFTHRSVLQLITDYRSVCTHQVQRQWALAKATGVGEHCSHKPALRWSYGHVVALFPESKSNRRVQQHLWATGQPL